MLHGGIGAREEGTGEKVSDVRAMEMVLYSVVEMYRTALECSEVWQWWNRSSLSALEKAYLVDMARVLGLDETGLEGG